MCQSQHESLVVFVLLAASTMFEYVNQLTIPKNVYFKGRTKSKSLAYIHSFIVPIPPKHTNYMKLKTELNWIDYLLKHKSKICFWSLLLFHLLKKSKPSKISSGFPLYEDILSIIQASWAEQCTENILMAQTVLTSSRPWDAIVQTRCV